METLTQTDMNCRVFTIFFPLRIHPNCFPDFFPLIKLFYLLLYNLGGADEEEVLRRQIARYHARCSGKYSSHTRTSNVFFSDFLIRSHSLSLSLTHTHKRTLYPFHSLSHFLTHSPTPTHSGMDELVCSYRAGVLCLYADGSSYGAAQYAPYNEKKVRACTYKHMRVRVCASIMS